MKLKMVLIAAALTATAFGATYENGTYRGNFTDSGENQVTVEFKIKDDVVTDAKYRHLTYKGNDYLKKEELASTKNQYVALLTNSIGKKVDEAIKAMHNPEKIEKAGATIRASKVRWAMKDALIHDVYTPEKK